MEKVFDFNEHSSCLNANEYELLNKYPVMLVIKTAYTGNGWTYGYGVSSKNWGSYCGCSNGELEILYTDERSAFLAAIDNLKNGRNRNMLLQQHIVSMDEQCFFPKYKQLELF